MKKIFLILAVLFTSLMVFAQTWETQKESNTKEQNALKKRLDDINARIYYLEQELPGKDDQKKGLVYNNRKTKKDKYLATEELTRLKSRKARLEEALGTLDVAYYATSEKQTYKETYDLPEKMGPKEYRQRSRSQAFQVLEQVQPLMNEQKELKGLLINYKRGLGEEAYFYFTRTDIKEAVDRPGFQVKPGEEKVVYLPMGVYTCEVRCGSSVSVGRVSVDPRTKSSVGKNNETVHFWAVKKLSDY